jgi:hypothetical protein
MSSPHPAEAAREALRWVDSVGLEVGCGRVWAERGELCDDLYAGTAGVLVGCAEATAAGLDAARVADGARARLVHLAHHEDAEPTTLPDDGLFSGWGGVAAALQAWSGVTGDGEAADAAGRARTRIAARSTQIAPQPSTDVISGDAGVAYALAAAGRELGRADLVEVAERGAEELLALGDHADGWAVPLVIPPQEHRPPVFFGWCHGPTGTVRLFALMWRSTRSRGGGTRSRRACRRCVTASCPSACTRATGTTSAAAAAPPASGSCCSTATSQPATTAC